MSDARGCACQSNWKRQYLLLGHAILDALPLLGAGPRGGDSASLGALGEFTHDRVTDHQRRLTNRLLQVLLLDIAQHILTLWHLSADLIVAQTHTRQRREHPRAQICTERGVGRWSLARPRPKTPPRAELSNQAELLSTHFVGTAVAKCVQVCCTTLFHRHREYIEAQRQQLQSRLILASAHAVSPGLASGSALNAFWFAFVLDKRDVAQESESAGAIVEQVEYTSRLGVHLSHEML